MEHILDTGKIRLSIFKNTNDPKESKNWNFSMSTNSEDEDEIDRSFNEVCDQATHYVKGHCKVLCMVKDDPHITSNSIDYSFQRGFSRPRMWAQYADNHSGICFIFDREKLEKTIKSALSAKGDIYFDDVTYRNFNPDQVHAFSLSHEEIQKNSLESVLNEKVKLHYKQYFFTKAEDWSSENEWRCILRGNDSEAEFIPIKDSICGIIVGNNFPNVYVPSITHFGKKYSVEVARIHWSNGVPIILPIQ